MCCYNTPGHAYVLSASSKEFPKLKFLINYRFQGGRGGEENIDHESLWLAKVLKESMFDKPANGNTWQLFSNFIPLNH